MTAFSAFFAGLLAAWPAPVAQHDVDGAETAMPVAVTQPDPLAVWAELAAGFRDTTAAQVRIEQHIIWRVSPIRRPARENMTALSQQGAPPPRFVERKMGQCVPMASIAGGRPESGSRLMLFMRDRRLIAANLEKSCSARDFYSGFYVDKPNSDGKLCVDRDRILARNGARCEIASFRLMVADD